MHTKLVAISVIVALTLLLSAAGSSAQGPEPVAPEEAQAPLGSGFTYQGQLLIGGEPAGGRYDFEFRLFSAASGGAQVGSPVALDDVEVRVGLFTVGLDFGAGAFDGQARWLEIRVREGGDDGAYTPLSPRQRLAPAPYALWSLRAPWGGLVGVPAGFADGVDNDTTYSAGTGLALEGTTLGLAGSYRLPQGCAAGRIARWDGSAWVCAQDDAGAGGDITAVTAGAGLTGGGESGNVSLAASFEGSGSATTVARSDHNHDGRYALASHEHSAAAISSGTLANGRFSAYSDLGAEGYLDANAAGDLLTRAQGDGRYWRLAGNAGTTPANFLGTTDNAALTLKVNNTTALRLAPSGGTPNLLGGWGANSAEAGVVGATIAGGGADLAANRVADNYGAVGGGANNLAGSDDGNAASAPYATVAGGEGNEASGLHSVVVGGLSSRASGSFATVGGGVDNLATNSNATVGGGSTNRAAGQYSTVAGGLDNGALASQSTVGGGVDNGASALAATVSGGSDNAASANYAVVGGGYDNLAGGPGATVAGGDSNQAIVDYATVGGGYWNQANAAYATIAGGGPASPQTDPIGTSNRVLDNYGTIGGGGNNRAGSGDGVTTNAPYTTIAGGQENAASAQHASVGGGLRNTASGGAATIAGGEGNTATAFHAAVGGGTGNEATAIGAAVAGGAGNGASNVYAAVAGGVENNATGTYAFVGAGILNQATGNSASVPGGRLNTAAGAYSFAAGNRAKANHDGTFVWADSLDSDFASTASNRFLVRARGGVGLGTNAPLAQLHVAESLNAATTLFNHVAVIENTAESAPNGAQVLALKVNVEDPGNSSNFVTFYDDDSVVGRIEGNGAGTVRYVTSGADLAEYLPAERSDRFAPGELVGLAGGRLSRRTSGAERVLVVSTAAGFVGNAPAGERVDGLGLVALLGQVPAKVRGPVRAGDYIVPSGRDDGAGVAVEPGSLTPAQVGQVVGRALESSTRVEVKTVKVLVGLSQEQLWSDLLQDRDEQIAALAAGNEALAEANEAQQAQIEGLEVRLAALEQGQEVRRTSESATHLGVAGLRLTLSAPLLIGMALAALGWRRRRRGGQP